MFRNGLALSRPFCKGDETMRVELTLDQAISKLQRNDQNGTWDEVTSISELKQCLIEAMEGYDNRRNISLLSIHL